MESKFDFLTAPRFYGSIFTAVGNWLLTPEPFTTHGVGVFMITLGGIFVAVETWDKTVKKIVAAKNQPTEQKLTVATDGGAATATSTNQPVKVMAVDPPAPENEL